MSRAQHVPNGTLRPLLHPPLLWGHLSHEEQGHLCLSSGPPHFSLPFTPRHNYLQGLEKIPSKSLLNLSASPPALLPPTETTIFSLFNDCSGLPQTILAPIVHLLHSSHRHLSKMQFTPCLTPFCWFLGYTRFGPCIIPAHSSSPRPPIRPHHLQSHPSRVQVPPSLPNQSPLVFR